MDKYIITYNDGTMKDAEKIIKEFHEFLNKERDILLMNKEVFDNIEIYKVDLIGNSIRKMEIKRE